MGVDSISGVPTLSRMNHPNFVMILMIPSLHWEDSSPKFSESCRSITQIRFGFDIKWYKYRSISQYNPAHHGYTAQPSSIPLSPLTGPQVVSLFPRRRLGSRPCLSFLSLAAEHPRGAIEDIIKSSLKDQHIIKECLHRALTFFCFFGYVLIY